MWVSLYLSVVALHGNVAVSTAPPTATSAHRKVVCTYSKGRYPSSDIGLCDVLTHGAKADVCYEAARQLVPDVFMNRPYKLARLFVQAEFQEHTLTWPMCWELFGLPRPAWRTDRNHSPLASPFSQAEVRKGGGLHLRSAPLKGICRSENSSENFPSSAADLFFNCH